jgi:hypothetical protein
MIYFSDMDALASEFFWLSCQMKFPKLDDDDLIEKKCNQCLIVTLNPPAFRI